ncbi:MAG: hypothetical protein KAW47_06520 [Thermoplasmatales archaeon]|jgi:hypothetical protein|nr:hypothetical protein [Pseudomonadota bacterium]MCK4348251.1 hypothetical protein [Thermoplasmatales archaeon]
MNKRYSVRGDISKGGFVSGVLLCILILLAPMMCYADRQTTNDFTLRVKLKGSVPVAVRDIAKYFRVVSVRDKKGNPVETGESGKIKEGHKIEVEFREGVDVFRFAHPVRAALYAPVYLEKQVEVKRVLGEELGGKGGTIIITKEGLGLEVKEDGTIVNLIHDRKVLDEAVTLIFKEDVVAWAERIVGMKPIRRRSFELLDRWVSAGEGVRMRVPISKIGKEESHLAVGFWTDHPDSALEEEAYLADITGIEQEKVRGSTYIYIIKARMPYLSELRHVVPGWYCPYPPKVKMTVTTKLDKNQIIAETFDLRVTRRGWAFVSGLLFLFIVFVVLMYVTREPNPHKKGTDEYKKWRETWKEEHKSDRMKRFFSSLLHFAVTPIGTYSISVTQALFWTFIVAFSCVYVYMLKASFIVIPSQILILLGITGGTALASRINAVSKDVVPNDLMKDIRKKRTPKLRDMIFIGGRMNIYKFQMMVFTLVTGIIVMAELIKACNFPEIPNTLIVLMGVSNTLYLGNEVTIEPTEGLRKKVEAYKEEKDDDKRNELGKEIKEMLSEY